MKRLPLHDVHAARGARFGVRADREVLAGGSDRAGEYAALTERAGLVDLSHWGKVSFRGRDARSFLNGLLTNDVLNLPACSGFPCCVLTPKGRLLGDFYLYDLGDELAAFGEVNALSNLAGALKPTIGLSETEMTPLGSDWSLILAAGPRASAAVKTATGLPDLGEWEALAAARSGEKVWGLSLPTIPGGVLLLSPPACAPGLWEALVKAGAEPAGTEALETMRIEQGLPVFGIDMDADSLLPEARLERAVSETKGCYMGQETIARLRTLGHVNKILAGLTLSGDRLPPTGVGVQAKKDGKAIGTITSVTHSPRAGAILALATLRAADAVSGTHVTVMDGDGIDATVVDLPLR